MSFELLTIGLLAVSSFFAYIVSVSPISQFTPQLIASFSIILLVITLRQKRLPLIFLSFIVNFLVFSTGALTSPLFFLIYFLLFIIAFQHPPSTTLSYSLILIVLLGQSLNSPISLVPLLSLLFITPLAWFVGQQYLENLRQSHTLATEETDLLLWLNLKFKTGITKIIDTSSILMSRPQLTATSREELKLIKDSAKNLLNSSQKLTSDISNDQK